MNVSSLDGPERAYIFLDPDGTLEPSLLVIVAAPTGVVYGHQCAGHVHEHRELEGFLDVVGGQKAAGPLRSFFDRTFHGWPPPYGGHQWTVEIWATLRELVSAIPSWTTTRDPTDPNNMRTFLEVDEARRDEVTDGWISVLTPLGPGVLVFKPTN